MVKDRGSTNRAVKKRTGKSSRGTKWTSDKKGVSINWPSIPGAEGIGWIGLFVSGIYIMTLYLTPKEFGPYRIWWILLGAGTSFLLIVSSYLLRESLSISSKRVQRSRFPSLFRAMQAVPVAQVVNAVVQLDIFHNSNNNSRIATVKLRIKRSDGIEWWPVGTQLNWSEAESLGRCLSRFTDVRVIRSEAARNA